MVGRDVVALLAIAMLGLLGGRVLRLPPIVAYLVAGVVAGPAFLGLVSRSSTVEQVAELGVALLLFGVGIEFSLDHLRRELGRMLASGGTQVALTVGLTALGFAAAGQPLSVALLAGFLVSLSSTAVVFRLYEDAGEIDAPEGQAAAGILLFQDLAMVPMILLVPVLAHPAEGALTAAGLALGTAVVALGALLLAARLVLPRALEQVARARTPELFTLAALVAAFGGALLAVQVGLSLPIGTFLAGLALSTSPYARQVFAEIVPLRDAFIAVFFTSIGLLLERDVLLAFSGPAAGMLVAVAGKAVIVGVVVGLVWRSSRLAILTGLGLAQIGEFSFVLARQGVQTGVIPPRFEQAFLAVAVLSMAATPFLLRLGRRLAHVHAADPGGPRSTLSNHVLVLGYGTTGQAIARVLGETGIPFVAVDLLAEHVATGRRDGVPVRFGDATRRPVLEELGAVRARAAVVTVGTPGATRTIVTLLRQLSPHVAVLVRARRVAEIDELERLGADEVVPSEFETSIELFVRLLRRLGVPGHITRIQESIIRTEHYRALRGLGTTAELMNRTKQLVAGGIVEIARVLPGSPASGRTLRELELRHRTGALVLSVVRAEEPLPVPTAETRLATDDIVVLFGPHEAIERALALLEPRGTLAGATRESG